MAPYGVCTACMEGQHEGCSNNDEPDTCGCLCSHRDTDTVGSDSDHHDDDDDH